MNVTTLNMTTLDGKVIIKKGGGGDIPLQDKVVDITENGIVELVADSEFKGLGKVIIKVNIIDRTKAPEGVSIQHIDGNFYSADDWVDAGFSNDKANGVAVNTKECGFIVRDFEWINVKWSSDTSNLVTGILTTTDVNLAKNDFSGKENTALILASDTNGAAYICANYTFPNGAKGYLPAAGEVYILLQKRSEINTILSLLGLGIIPSNPLWTSTQYSATEAWAGFNKQIDYLEKKQMYSAYTIPFLSLNA